MRSFYLACALTGVGLGAAIAPVIPVVATRTQCLDIALQGHPRITPDRIYNDCVQQLSLPE